ncbi:MAG: TAXI family TRAP transporter solute-binding subunit [Clostridiaceae bacterium]|nr:TAXI family TRAP transporter solute-binding subunit [Clostridiaceae bacterium]
MRKVLSLSLAVALTAGLMAGCGGSSKPAETKAPEAAQGTEAQNSGGSSAKAQDLVMGTGSTGGTYFALGGAMANAINNKLADQKITITAQSTGASVENINLINAGEMDLGIAMNNVAADAHAGKGSFSAPVTNVRAIGVVYSEVYQIVANAATTKAETVQDLKGLKVAVGPAGSGTVGLTEQIFKAAGLDIDKDIERQSDSFGDAATKMQDGHIDAACNTLAVPASAIVEMTTSMDLRYINISDEILTQLPEYFTRKIIPAGTYPKQDKDCETVTCKAVLYCSADLDEETVYQITKAYYTSGDEIAAAHETGKEVNVETCLEGVTTPIHPGAARYFKELGMDVPDNG